MTLRAKTCRGTSLLEQNMQENFINVGKYDQLKLHSLAQPILQLPLLFQLKNKSDKNVLVLK